MISEICTWLSENYEAVVAVSALFIAFYSAQQTRKHNRLSVKPHITAFPNTDINPRECLLSVELMNNGLGPAIIKKYLIYFDGKIVADTDYNTLKNFFDNLIKSKKKEVYQHTIAALGKDYAMPANEKRVIISIKFPIKSKETEKEFEELLDKFDLIVEYESFYGKKFLFDSRGQEKGFTTPSKPSQD